MTRKIRRLGFSKIKVWSLVKIGSVVGFLALLFCHRHCCSRASIAEKRRRCCRRTTVEAVTVLLPPPLEVAIGAAAKTPVFLVWVPQQRIANNEVMNIKWKQTIAVLQMEKFGEANKFFANLDLQSSVPWTALISGNVQKGHPEEYIKLFIEMQRAEKTADATTYASILKACANLASQALGKQLHYSHIIISGHILCF
ncbi:pentatricopeptide repeat-containing protein At3g20730-like [Arachis ipaensis]|uniref:pentatricopeptide repeat-containing protein At3g20730-like n=1 Tax=Arachis ipaensis TaxID=130454 RepID=UPI000A2B5DAF|nr:pentatricopeptide repeat-containing protein At3g20730-like [Arachis ipaensis]